MKTSSAPGFKETITGPSDLSLKYFKIISDQIGYLVPSVNTTFNPGEAFVIIEERIGELEDLFKGVLKKVIERNKEILVELAKH